MIVRELTSLYNFLGDAVVYRNLQPVDSRLPCLSDVAEQLGLQPNRIPRKTELSYARVTALMLSEAARLLGNPVPKRLLVVGDTRMNDGTAFKNMCQVTGWPGLAIICAEKPAELASLTQAEESLYVANRWSLLEELPALLEQCNFPVDESTAIIVDLDKTVLGARGLNDHVIDEARVEGVRVTASALLGSDYREEPFLAAYRRLNQPEFHHFTADNQDYLVYICLIIAAGLYTLENVAREAQEGSLNSFDRFIAAVDSRSGELAGSPLLNLHESFYELFLAGDPTPFKLFRRNEFHATVKRMGCLGETPSIQEALRSEIVITLEVAQLVQSWHSQGAVILGISDKPDEAALPTPEDSVQGYPPLHRAHTHAVGEDIL